MPESLDNVQAKMVGVRLTIHHHQLLNHLTLLRSAQLGRGVSAGFVIQELVEQHLQALHPELRTSELYGSRD